MSRPWIKMHTTTLDDVRLLRLNDRQQLRYFQMYLLAGRLNADGLFVENNERLSDTDIAIKLRVRDNKQFAADINALRKAGLIKVNGHGPFIEAFAREQVDWSRKQEQDRERQNKKRHSPVTRDSNVTKKPSRVSHKPVTPLDQKEIKKKKKKKKEIKNPPPPPSSTPTASRVGGGKSTASSSKPLKDKSDWMSALNQQERELAQIITPIFTASGLNHKKLVTLLPIVATRMKPADAKRMTLAALASVWGDVDIRNKPVVAAYRLENDQVPTIFTNSSTWRALPAAILAAADVDIDRLPRETAKTSSNDVISKVAAHVAANR